MTPKKPPHPRIGSRRRSRSPRYSGPDHKAAITLLARVDQSLSKRLSRLITLKSDSQYGAGLLNSHDREVALREAATLIDEAERRLVG